MGLFAESRKVISKKGLFSQSRITTPSVITTPPVYWNKEKDEPVQKTVAPKAVKTVAPKVIMPIRTQSVRTEPATTQKKKIGGPQYEPAYATPTVTPSNPVAKLTGSLAERFMSNPANRAVVQSVPAQFIDKNLRAGTSALATGISNVGAGIAQFSDQLMSKARSLPMSTLPAFAQTPSTQAAVQSESEAGQQRRANVRANVEGQISTVQKNLKVTDKQTQGLGYGVLAAIPQMATFFVPGGKVAFFSSTAGNYASQAEKSGANPDQALAYGLIGGAVELATEMVFFILPQGVRKIGQSIISKVAKAGAGEGFQEAITDPIMGMAEKFIYNPDKAWYGADGVVDPALMGKDALAGAIMGVMFMGLASSNATVKQKAQTAITEAQTSGTGVPIEVVQDIANGIKNQTQPIQQNAPQSATGTLNANVEQPTLNVSNLQHFGMTEPGPMDGTGKVVESKMSENIRAGRTGEQVLQDIFTKDPLMHRQLTKTDVMAELGNRMSTYDGTVQSFDKTYQEWADRMDGSSMPDAADVAMTGVIQHAAILHGQGYRAEQAASMLGAINLQYGRVINANRYNYKPLTPNVVSESAAKVLKKVNTEGAKKYGDKWNALSYSKGEVEAFRIMTENYNKSLTDMSTKHNSDMAATKQIQDAAQKAQAEEAAKTERDTTLETVNEQLRQDQVEIQDHATARWSDSWLDDTTGKTMKLPKGAWESWNSWRRFVMLTSPKTHLRNLSSNVLRAGAEVSKDTIATGLEKILVPQAERRHALVRFWGRDAGARNNATHAEWLKVKNELVNAVKYDEINLPGLEAKRKLLPAGIQEAHDATMGALSVGDQPFLEFAFKNALGQNMKAQRATVATDEMIKYAKDVALENTFKLKNSLSKMLMDVKRGRYGKALSMITEATLPYTVTPAALAKTVVDFIPGAGFATMKKGPNAADITDALAKQIVGGLIIWLGAILSKAGIAYGKDLLSTKAKEIEELGGGRQRNSVTIGDSTYTIDSFQPMSTLLLMGINLMQDGKKDQNIANAVTGVLTASYNTFFDQSLLQGVSKIFGSQNKGEAVLDNMVGYLEQGIPTLLTQLQQQVSGKGVKRQTYYSNDFWGNVGRTIQNKTVPGGLVIGGKEILKPLEPQLTAFGEPKTVSVVQGIISPTTIKKKSDDPVARMMYDVYKKAQELNDVTATDALVSNTPSVIDKQKLTAEERTQFTDEYGHMAYDAAKKEFDKQGFQNASDEDKVKRLKKTLKAVYDKAIKSMGKEMAK